MGGRLVELEPGNRQAATRQLDRIFAEKDGAARETALAEVEKKFDLTPGEAAGWLAKKTAPAQAPGSGRTAFELSKPAVARKIDLLTSAPRPLQARAPSSAAATRALGQALTAAGISPKSSLRVVELGVGTDAAESFLRAGAQVVGVDDSREALGSAKERDFRYHHLALGGPGQASPLLGVRAQNADLVLSDGGLEADFAAGRGQAALNNVSRALDVGGTFALSWTPVTGADPRAVESMVKAAGLELVSDAPVEGRQVLLAKKPGEPRKLPESLEDLSRTSSVDRGAILAAHDRPLLQGPLSTERVEGNDPKLRAQLDAMLAAVKDYPEVDPASVPLPTTTAREAFQGAPKVDALVLFAHPDDETGFAGGTLQAASDAGYTFKIASVTGGEGGRLAKQTGPAAESRGKELAEVAKLLGSDGIELYGFSDFGKYTDAQRSVPATREDSLKIWNLMPLVERIVRSIREDRPQTLLTFDPQHDPDYALHGHHQATGLAAMLAFHLAADPQAFPEQLKEGLQPWAVKREAVVVSPERTQGTVQVPIDPQRKKTALEAHGSQQYSLEEIFKGLDARKPSLMSENWHVLQSREPPASGNPNPLASLFGDKIGR